MDEVYKGSLQSMTSFHNSLMLHFLGMVRLLVSGKLGRV